jgi:hypothetical protein
VPFLKFSRDKRGYQNFYLIEPPSGRRNDQSGGKSRPRILFWFRSPPDVKVGRAPFSEDVQKMVEAQNPGIAFDWPRIISTPIPAPDPADHWRERRRMEKAAKRAAREDVAEVETPIDIQAEPAVAASDSQATSAPASPSAETGPRRHRRRRRGRRGRTDQSAQPDIADGQSVLPLAEDAVELVDNEPEVPPTNEV